LRDDESQITMIGEFNVRNAADGDFAAKIFMVYPRKRFAVAFPKV